MNIYIYWRRGLVTELIIEELWCLKINANDFYNIERGPKTVDGGGGQTFIQIPKALVKGLLTFFREKYPEDEDFVFEVKNQKQPDMEPEELDFGKQTEDRMRIKNQKTHSRLSAWHQNSGFPSLETVAKKNKRVNNPFSKDDAEELLNKIGQLHIYLARTSDGEIWAGYTKGEPDIAQKKLPFSKLLWGDSPGGYWDRQADEIMKNDKVLEENKKTIEVINALKQNKNVLLYGPPGTGKTWLLSEIINSLQCSPTLRLGQNQPFGLTHTDNSLPKQLKIEWLTFHQSYSYEEFIIGKKPKPKDSGIILEPHFGVLMSLAVSLDLGPEGKGCLLIIDEINRANASQVFGEFITLLDPSYRRTIYGNENYRALSIKLPGIEYDSEGMSEYIRMLHGGKNIKLPEDWTFPEHIYVLATMNSVDKAALPLDSALTRRFHRIEMLPDIDLLAEKLSVNMEALKNKVRETSNDSGPRELSAEETTILLLDRLNFFIASDMGNDFELGHALVWDVVKAKEDSRWRVLINVWDHILYPQLAYLFAGNDNTLKEILKVYKDSKSKEAFFERNRIGSDAINIEPPLKVIPLHDIEEKNAMAILKYLAI